MDTRFQFNAKWIIYFRSSWKVGAVYRIDLSTTLGENDPVGGCGPDVGIDF